MKCYNCGNTFTSFTGGLELPSSILGNFTINNVNYLKCGNCGEIFLSDEAWCLADKVENQLITDFISNLPFNKFIGASKAASILGKSRQALHKHRRIRRGFIYSITLEGKKYYHIDSVKLFKKSGDGRFSLITKLPRRKKEYIVVTIPPLAQNDRFHDSDFQIDPIGWSSHTGFHPQILEHSYGK
jgi:hypothetical protein